MDCKATGRVKNYTGGLSPTGRDKYQYLVCPTCEGKGYYRKDGRNGRI